MAEFEYIDDLTVTHHCRANTFNKDANSFTGPRCKRTIGPGEKVCYKHGGTTPNVKRAALDRRNEYMARMKLANQAQARGIDRIEDAVEELELIASEAKAFKDICWARVQAIKDDWRYSTAAGEQLRAEVALYERAMDRCEKVLVNYVRLGIADKRVKIAEAQAMLLVGVIQNILGRLELSRDQKRIAASVVPEELRAISGPQEQAEDA